MTLPLVPPRVPICRSAEDAIQPCRYWQSCAETRQRIQHYNDPPQRGMACWAFQQRSDKEFTTYHQETPPMLRAGEADLERAAIAEEGE